MEPAIPKKLKAQCQTCKKSFGGTVEKLNATAKCPKCGAEGDWWRPVETRMLQRARIQAQQQQQPYYAPPLAGRDWVPRPGSKNRELVFGLGMAGIVLSPIGLITGPWGLWKGIEDIRSIKRGEAQADPLLIAGMLGCVVSIIAGLFGAWLTHALVDYGLQSDKIDRATRELNQVGQAVEDYANEKQEFPRDLAQVRAAGAEFPEHDPWGNDWRYELWTDGARLTSYGADGEFGGALANADIEATVTWVVSPFDLMYPGYKGLK